MGNRSGCRRARGTSGLDETSEGMKRGGYRWSAFLGSMRLTSTEIRLRSTVTTPLAMGRLLASTLTSSCYVASSSMMAPRLSRIT